MENACSLLHGLFELRSSFLRLSFAARAVLGLGYKEFPQTAFQNDAFMGIGSFIQGRFNDKTQKVRCMLDGKVQILPAQDVGKKRAGKDISCTAGPKGEFWYFILFREKLTVRLTGNGNMAAVRRNTRNDDCFGSQRKELIAQGFEFLIRRGKLPDRCIRMRQASV